ncbi:MAG TPA: NAD-dependent epimerase/dehydratase family protein [Chthoniobacteraceae bacterium]|jgi:nucleoside-diphosphate-sugar epimerase|nr:NAD-dependent epimerase/dehydratase family protein [Chthoniobacteraceae bacterium]
MKKAVILGCGFVGMRVARLFVAEGWETIGVTRTSALGGEKFRSLACDISDPAQLAAAGELHNADAVICAASSGRGGEEAYRAVYLRGVQNALACLHPGRLLFVSSTSVYAQNDGAWVTESSPAEPRAATSRILREAEEAALAAGGTVARLAGIYGPGRSVLLRKFLDRSAIIEGEGSRHINQIHAGDAATALFHLIARGAGPGIYNVADDSPLTQLACYQWLASHLRMPLPPRGEADANRKRGVTDKRVSNAKLRSLGWTPVYPSFSEAMLRDPALLAAARAGGSGDAPS